MTDDDMQKLRAAFDETAERLVSATRHQFEISTEAISRDIRLLAEGVVTLGERVSREIGRLTETEG